MLGGLLSREALEVTSEVNSRVVPNICLHPEVACRPKSLFQENIETPMTCKTQIALSTAAHMYEPVWMSNDGYRK
jgi:hypothetical protein